jgi:hypothetical protein
LVDLEHKVLEIRGFWKTGDMSGVTVGWDYVVRELPRVAATEEKYREMEEWMAKRKEGGINELTKAQMDGK